MIDTTNGLLSPLYINPIPILNPFSHSPLYFSYFPLYHFPNPKMGDADLGLSLSFPHHHHHHHHHHVQTTSATHPLQLNLMIPQCLVTPHNHQQKKSSTMEAGLLCSNRNYETRAFLRVIDVNQAPSESTECEDDPGVSSPNSTVSTISGKRNERETNPEDPDNERASSRGAMSDEEDGENCRKKLRLSKDQSAVLEESFGEHNTLNPKQKQALAKQLGLRPRQVEVWFQNRRARTKLKQTEVDCEFLKRCCENLTEENRRLHKEVQELRALKLSPQFFMHMTPPTTLTMCPSCERVSVPLSSSSCAIPDRSRPVAIAPIAYPMFDALRPRS